VIVAARRVGLASSLVTVALAVGGCRPSAVADAEAKGDAAWLDAEGSPEATAALGRLADRDAKAETAIAARAKVDVNGYIAAWSAVHRGVTWGGAVLHDGLGDPVRAEVAASALDGKDDAARPFLPDIEAAMLRLAASAQSNTLAAVLAAAGPPAHAAIVRRLGDALTRGAMCGGIAAPQASADAHAALRAVPPSSRDAAACVGAVVHLAATDDETRKWLATGAEPGLLVAASREKSIDCGALHTVWVDALAHRPPAEYAGLTVPLSLALHRCPRTMDGVVADALKTRPEAQAAVMGAIDPFDVEIAALGATCAAIPGVARGRAPAVTRERASDAMAHGCRGER
jgi:hypothetical protein